MATERPERHGHVWPCPGFWQIERSCVCDLLVDRPYGPSAHSGRAGAVSVSDGMVRFGENNWIRASLIESVYPFDKDLTHKWEYQVLVRLVGGRRWIYTVSEAPVGATPERIEVQEAAKAKRNAYLDEFLLRMAAVSG